MALRVDDSDVGDKIVKILDDLEDGDKLNVDTDDESVSSEIDDNVEIEDERQ